MWNAVDNHHKPAANCTKWHTVCREAPICLTYARAHRSTHTYVHARTHTMEQFVFWESSNLGTWQLPSVDFLLLQLSSTHSRPAVERLTGVYLILVCCPTTEIYRRDACKNLQAIWVLFYEWPGTLKARMSVSLTHGHCLSQTREEDLRTRSTRIGNTHCWCTVAGSHAAHTLCL